MKTSGTTLIIKFVYSLYLKNYNIKYSLCRLQCSYFKTPTKMKTTVIVSEFQQWKLFYHNSDIVDSIIKLGEHVFRRITSDWCKLNIDFEQTTLACPQLVSAVCHCTLKISPRSLSHPQYLGLADLFFTQEYRLSRLARRSLCKSSQSCRTKLIRTKPILLWYFWH